MRQETTEALKLSLFSLPQSAIFNRSLLIELERFVISEAIDWAVSRSFFFKIIFRGFKVKCGQKRAVVHVAIERISCKRDEVIDENDEKSRRQNGALRNTSINFIQVERKSVY
jgi:hypothetical protein